jgi:hypothetical protein
MKIKLKFQRGLQYLDIVYSEEERKLLAEKLHGLGLTESETVAGFGNNQKLKYFRSTNRELSQFLQMGEGRYSNYVDDINAPLFRDGSGNVAIFRVIPDDSGKVSILLSNYLSIADLRLIANMMRESYTKILNIASEKEIEIKIKKI